MLRASIIICVGITAASAYAADALQFNSDAMRFDNEEIRFETVALTFPNNLIATDTAADTIEIILPADVLFDFDKADIRADAQAPLHEVAQLLQGKARGTVQIQGFSDALGNDSYNQKLSDRRANAVKVWLATREKLATMKFATAGLGARNPVAPNRNADGSDNPAGRQMNRRVTIIMHH